MEPEATQGGPYIIREEPGKRYWCACGRSANQPYCDGSHKGTGIRPVAVEIDTARTVAYCGCRQSGTKPFCDGTHSRGTCAGEPGSDSD